MKNWYQCECEDRADWRLYVATSHLHDTVEKCQGCGDERTPTGTITATFEGLRPLRTTTGPDIS